MTARRIVPFLVLAVALTLAFGAPRFAATEEAIENGDGGEHTALFSEEGYRHYENLGMDRATVDEHYRVLVDRFDRLRSRFREENAALEANDRPVVFLGDSLTEWFDLSVHFPGLHTLNRGISSDRIDRTERLPLNFGVMTRLEESVFDTQASAFVILIGTNHMGDHDFDIDVMREEYEKMLDAIEDAFPQAPLFLHSVPPLGRSMEGVSILNSRVRMFNTRVRDIAEERGHTFVDLHALLRDDEGFLPSELTWDDIHFTEQAYVRWAGALREAFEEVGIETAGE